MNVVRPALGGKDFEDKEVLKQLNRIFIGKRGYDFNLPAINQSLVLLVSGGLDSICLWNLLLKKYKLHVYPVHFLNRNRHYPGEETSLGYYSKLFKERYPKYFHPVKNIKTHATNRINVLTEADIKNDIKIVLQNLVYNQAAGKNQVAITYNANPLYDYFFNVYIYAQKLRASVDKNLKTILVSFVPEDAGLSRNSTLTVMRSVNLSLCLITGDFSWQFSGAFEKDNDFYFPKDRLIKQGQSDKIPLEKTWSCMNEGKRHCGKCGGCVIRKEAFRQAGVTDRTVYKKNHRFHFGLRRFFSLFKFSEKEPILDKKKLEDYLFSPTDDVNWQEIKGKVNLLHKSKGEIDILNRSGSLLWKDLMREKASFRSLMNRLQKTYRVDKKILERDLKNFLVKYTSEGYLNFSEKG